MDVAHLDAVPLFAGLSNKQRQRVAQHADELDVAAGKELVHQDGLAWEFFVIKSGEAVVRQGVDTIRTLGAGDFFGEIASLDTAGTRRTASVITTTAMTAIVMTSHDLRALAREIPALASSLRSTIAERTSEHP